MRGMFVSTSRPIVSEKTRGKYLRAYLRMGVCTFRGWSMNESRLLFQPSERVLRLARQLVLLYRVYRSAEPRRNRYNFIVIFLSENACFLCAVSLLFRPWDTPFIHFLLNFSAPCAHFLSQVCSCGFSGGVERDRVGPFSLTVMWDGTQLNLELELAVSDVLEGFGSWAEGKSSLELWT